MGERKHITPERWSEYLDSVTTGNRGRLIAADVAAPSEISAVDEIDIPELGAPLFALEYEPAGKGDAIILSTGENELEYEHAIKGPTELTETLNDDGSLDSLEILDQGGGRTRLNFLD
jgi:hypothetical protein